MLWRYYELTCDVCGRSWSTDYGEPLYEKREELLKKAKEHGWKIISKNEVYCPECNENGYKLTDIDKFDKEQQGKEVDNLFKHYESVNMSDILTNKF